MSFNNNYLVDEIFQEKNQFLKDCLKELIDNHLLYIFKKKENYFLSRISKNSDEEFKKDKYLYIREIFINLDYFIACFKFNLLEIPKCPFCGNPKKLKTKDFSATCGKKECVDKKRKLFNLEKYGSACNLQNPLIKEKSIKTMRERYGVDNASKSMQLLEKKRLNNLHKYGVDFPLQLNSIKEKIKETNLKKYGVSNAAKNEEIKKKIEFTNRKNHGGFWNNQLESDKEKRALTYKVNREKGKHKIRQSRGSLYTYNSIDFDSSAELAFYIYKSDLGCEISREPIALEYYVEGKPHLYYPDFKIGETLYEIKGSFGINYKGEFTLPIWSFKKILREEPDSFKAMKRIIKEDKLYKEKHKIALENNVVILKSDDEELNNCMRYCENKYNDKKWYIQFKKSS